MPCIPERDTVGLDVTGSGPYAPYWSSWTQIYALLSLTPATSSPSLQIEGGMMDNIPSLPLLLSGVASPGYCDMEVREGEYLHSNHYECQRRQPRSKWNEILCMPWLIGLPNLGSSQGGVSRTSKTSGAFAVIKARAGWCVLQFSTKSSLGYPGLSHTHSPKKGRMIPKCFSMRTLAGGGGVPNWGEWR